MTGYSREELLAMNFWQLILPGSRKALIDRADKNGDGDENFRSLQDSDLDQARRSAELDVRVGMFELDGGLAALISVLELTEQEKPASMSLDRFAPVNLYAEAQPEALSVS